MPLSSDAAKKPTFAAKKSAAQQSVTFKAKDPDLQFVPTLVKHMALAIFKNKYRSSGGRESFAEAFAIARGLLSDYKHLTPSSRAPSAIGKINLTGSGRILESKHRREQGSLKKTLAFDLLYMRFLSQPTGSKPSDNAGKGKPVAKDLPTTGGLSSGPKGGAK